MRPPLPGALWALLAGYFVIGTGVMVVPGTPNEISTSLAVSAATAGQLITVAAIVMCLGAPLLAAMSQGGTAACSSPAPCSGMRWAMPSAR